MKKKTLVITVTHAIPLTHLLHVYTNQLSFALIASGQQQNAANYSASVLVTLEQNCVTKTWFSSCISDENKVQSL